MAEGTYTDDSIGDKSGSSSSTRSSSNLVINTDYSTPLSASGGEMHLDTDPLFLPMESLGDLAGVSNEFDWVSFVFAFSALEFR